MGWLNDAGRLLTLKQQGDRIKSRAEALFGRLRNDPALALKPGFEEVIDELERLLDRAEKIIE